MKETRNKNYILQDVAGKRIMNFAEAVAHGMQSKSDIAKFIGVGSTQVSKIESMAEQIGIVDRTKDSVEIITIKHKHFLQNLSSEKLNVLFLEYLRRYKPFAKFYHFLSLGYLAEKAAQRACAICSVKREVKSALKMLRAWGVYAGILTLTKDGIIIIKGLENKSLEKLDHLRRSFEDAFSAQEYLNQLLGDKAYESIDQQDREELIKAMTTFIDNPRNAIKITREVLEDYLSDFGIKVGVDLSREGTLNKKLLKLRQNHKIAKKHVPILEGLEVMMEEDMMKNIGAFGNLTHHGKIDEEMVRWSVSAEIALCVILETILTIKSIYFYGTENQTLY